MSEKQNKVGAEEKKYYTAVLNSDMSYSVYLGDHIITDNLIHTYDNSDKLLEWIKTLNENEIVDIKVGNFM